MQVANTASTQQGIPAKFGLRSQNRQAATIEAQALCEKRLALQALQAQLANKFDLPWPPPSTLAQGRPTLQVQWDLALGACVRHVSEHMVQPQWWRSLLGLNLKAGAPPRDWNPKETIQEY